MYRRMTAQEVDNACKANNYLLLRSAAGFLYGVNGRMSEYAKRQKGFNPKQETKFVGFIPCGLHEYITHKVPFK